MHPKLGCLLLPIFAYWSARDFAHATVRFIKHRRTP